MHHIGTNLLEPILRLGACPGEGCVDISFPTVAISILAPFLSRDKCLNFANNGRMRLRQDNLDGWILADI